MQKKVSVLQMQVPESNFTNNTDIHKFPKHLGYNVCRHGYFRVKLAILFRGQHLLHSQSL